MTRPHKKMSSPDKLTVWWIQYNHYQNSLVGGINRIEPFNVKCRNIWTFPVTTYLNCLEQIIVFINDNKKKNVTRLQTMVTYLDDTYLIRGHRQFTKLCCNYEGALLWNWNKIKQNNTALEMMKLLGLRRRVWKKHFYISFISRFLMHAEPKVGWTAGDAHNICSCNFTSFNYAWLLYVSARVITLYILQIELWFLCIALPLINLDHCMKLFWIPTSSFKVKL